MSGSNLEEACDKDCLGLHVLTANIANLPLSDHCHYLVSPAQRPQDHLRGEMPPFEHAILPRRHPRAPPSPSCLLQPRDPLCPLQQNHLFGCSVCAIDSLGG